MDRVFSVDDISDHFWSPPPPLSAANRNSSEWCFQRFLLEASATSVDRNPSPPPHDATATSPDHQHPPHIAATSADYRYDPPAQNDAVEKIISKGQFLDDSNKMVDIKQTTSFKGQDNMLEYEAFLRNKLAMACKAVANTRASGLRPQESATIAPDIMSQPPTSVQIISQASPAGSGSNLGNGDVGPSVKPSLPAAQKKPCVQVRSTTSWSSGDQSDDDDEADGETTDNVNPLDAKRMRRKLSNRISAQRSRKRKQNHLTELETQVSQLTDEHSLLLKRLSVSSQNYNEAAVDNRVLKADVETLRAKVKMAEETVKRITGFNPFLQSMSEISMSMLPSYAGVSSDASTDASVPIQDNPKQQYYLPPTNNHLHSHTMGIPNRLVDIVPVDNVQHPPVGSTAVAGANKIGTPSTMQRVGSLEHLQKCIPGGLSAGRSRGDESRD
ncbi:basic leucine zipper transcription factor [Lithospermum erythrorhizon]|uniref:Basic leucine zipper transcription factor n=1 Tax=Lithospermum erythrorhizon TaxID=34254 RepID=A0AAV3P621_LITER